MSSSSNVQPQQEQQQSPSLQPAQQQQPSRPIQQQQQQQHPSTAFINYYPYQNPPQMGQQSTPQRQNPTQPVQPRQQVPAEEQRQQQLQYMPLQPPPQQQLQQSQSQQQQQVPAGSKQHTLFRVLSGQPNAQGVRPYFVRPVTSRSGFSQQPQPRPMQQQQQYPSNAFINYYPYQNPQQPYHIPPQMHQQSTPQRQNLTHSVQPHQQVATEEHRQQTPQYVQPHPQQQLQQSQNQQQLQSQNQQQGPPGLKQQPVFRVVPGKNNAQGVRPYFVRSGISQQPQPQPRLMQQIQNLAPPPTSVAAPSLSYHSFQSPPPPQNPQQSYSIQPQIRHQSTTPQRQPSSTSSQKTASVEKQQRPSIGEKRPLSVSSADDEMLSSSSIAVVEERPSSADEQSLLYLEDSSLLAAFEDSEDGPSSADSLNQPAKSLTELDKKKIRVTQIAYLEFTLEFCGKVQIGENEYTAIPSEIIEEKNNLEREIQNETEYETFSERVKSHQNQS